MVDEALVVPLLFARFSLPAPKGVCGYPSPVGTFDPMRFFFSALLNCVASAMGRLMYVTHFHGIVGRTQMPIMECRSLLDGSGNSTMLQYFQEPRCYCHFSTVNLWQ
ncbi:hypothetical protein TNCV_1272541 [Trichonephila clavipes]|nr:hypothetical protein TNCV_1272541 [Trichonephila clavipes]